MELVLGPHRFDLHAGVVVLPTVEVGIELDDTVAATSVASSTPAMGPVLRGPLAAALDDAERLIAAGADAVELDICSADHRHTHDGPTGSDAVACTVAAITARLSVPVGVRTADPTTAMTCLEAGATLLSLPFDTVDRCLADTAFVRAIEANGAAVMVGKSSAPDAAAPQAALSDQLAVELSIAAARARDVGLPIERVVVDLTDPPTRGAIAADHDLEVRDDRLRSRRAAELARVIDAVDRLVRDGQLIAVGGWDERDPECAIALASLMISRGARVVRSRSPRLVRRIARAVDAMSAATRPAVPRTPGA